jgi:hypothetical protein
MTPRIQRAFLALVLTQGVHSIEEYALRFYEVFPPAQLLGELIPGIAHPGFIAVNLSVFLLGLWCFFFRVRPGAENGAGWVGLWVVVELFNGVAHPIWALSAGAYRPGLVSSPVLFALAVYLAVWLRASRPRDPSPDTLLPG